MLVSSARGLLGHPAGYTAYCASKAGLHALTRAIAVDHGPDGVRCNAVAPGLVATPWTSEWGDLHASISAIAPAGRSATPEDCAQILDRMVELELGSQGYSDPVLVARTRTTFRAQHEDELASCVGRRLPEGAMECIARASDIETLIHTCLYHRTEPGSRP